MHHMTQWGDLGVEVKQVQGENAKWSFCKSMVLLFTTHSFYLMTRSKNYQR
jgi:hypothetical protein